MNGLAIAARVVHVVLLALGIGAAAQLLMLPDALPTLQASAEIANQLRAQLDGFVILAAPPLLLTLALGWMPLQAQLRSRAIGIGVWAILALVSGRWLNPRIEAAQARLGRALDGLPSDAAGVSDWAQLSTVSHALLIAQLAVGILLLLWSMTAGGPKRSYGGIQL